MDQANQTILDFDRTVGTEDRFAIRRFIENFSNIISNAHKSDLDIIIADGAVTAGITEFPLQKSQLIEMLYKKFFGRRHNFFILPKLKLTYSKFLFHLNGSYEEYEQGILSGSGTIEIVLVKNENYFQVFSLKFFPRMLKQENYD